MKIINVIQGSAAWLELRATHFTASEAPAMMNDSKYMSRDQLLHMKATGEVKPVSSYQQTIFDKGHATEEMARPIIEGLIGEDLYPVTGILENTKLLASFDGLTLLEDIAFEHKLYNAALADNVRHSILEPHYYWQLEQQLLVSGAEKAIFVTSNGTTENMERMEYRSIPERREFLIAGWAQFEKDLANYEVKAKVEKVVGTNVTELPALMVELTGQVNSSNLVVYKQNVLEFIQNINTNLQTDQDFADAENIVKFCTKAEKEIEAVKQRALDSTADIKTLFAELDLLKEEMRQKRLSLDKTVKLRKTEVKTEITTAAHNELDFYLGELNEKLNGIVTVMVDSDFVSAIKGKRTVESIHSAANDHLAKCKIEADATFAKYSTNLAVVEEIAADYKFLFNDIAHIVIQEPDHFRMTVKSRVDAHLEAEKARLEQEREQMRLEEERKAKVKADLEVKAEQDRINADLKAKHDAEAERVRLANEAQAAQQREQTPVVETLKQNQPIAKTMASIAPTLAAMKTSIPTFEAKSLSSSTDNVSMMQELSSIFGENSFGELLYDESGNRYELKIEVSRVAIVNPQVQSLKEQIALAKKSLPYADTRQAEDLTKREIAQLEARLAEAQAA